MSEGELRQLQLRCRELEGQLSESQVLVHQLQLSLSEAQALHIDLRAQLNQSQAELHRSDTQTSRLRDELDTLSDEYQTLLERGYVVGNSQTNRRGNRNSLSAVYAAPSHVDTETRWVQTSDDMLPVPFHVEEELRQLREEVANWKSLGHEGHHPRQRSGSAYSDMSTDSGDLRSDSDAVPSNASAGNSASRFAPPPPLALRLNLAMPPAVAPQASMLLHEEPSALPEDTPRYASYTGRLRADQPLNLTQAMAAVSQRQVTARDPSRRLALHTPRPGMVGQTPRAGGFNPGLQGSINSVMSPRMNYLADRLDRIAATPRDTSHMHDGSSSMRTRPAQQNDILSSGSLEALPSAPRVRGQSTMSNPPSLDATKRAAVAVLDASDLEQAECKKEGVVQDEQPELKSSENAEVTRRSATPSAPSHSIEVEHATPQEQKTTSSVTAAERSALRASVTSRRFAAEPAAADDAVDDFWDEEVVKANMFGLAEVDTAGGPRCSVCELMCAAKDKFSNRMTSRQAYYAAGFLPELCERWQIEHQLVWTIEERASIATTLYTRPPLENFSTWHLASEGKYWKPKGSGVQFWKSNWRDCYFLLQGVFLYVFPPTQKKTDKVLSVCLIRSAEIITQRNHDKLYVLRLNCLGCDACVRADDSQHIEEVIIGFKDEIVMLEWKETLTNLSQTCPHMCSSKFANSVTALSEICESLIAVAYREEKRALKAAAARSQRGKEV